MPQELPASVLQNTAAALEMAACTPSVQNVLTEAFGNEYQVLRMLAKTLYGAAFLAQTEAEEKVVIKISLRTALEGRKCHDNPEREIEMLRKLRGSDVHIQLLNYSITKTAICTVTSYARHGELYNYLSTQRSLSEAEVRIIGRQLLQAVQELEDLGYVNMDYSTENIVLEQIGSAAQPENWRVRILDLGCVVPTSFANREEYSKLMDRAPLMGKPGYRAPELGASEPTSAPIQTNVWTLAVILYMMLTKCPPYKDQGDVWYELMVSKRWIQPSVIQELIRNNACPYSKLSRPLLEMLGEMFQPAGNRIKFNDLLDADWWQSEN